VRKPKTYRVDFVVTTFVTAFSFREAMKVARKAVKKGEYAVAKFDYSVQSSSGQTPMEFMQEETPNRDRGDV